MSRAQVREVRHKATLVVVLALVAGWIDGVGFVILLHLFTAHMSGNSIGLGVHLGQHDWERAFHRFFPIPVFVAGVALGAALCETLLRRGVRSTFAVALALEAALLGLFVVGGWETFRGGLLRSERDWQFYALAALPALAMGLQSAALRRVGGVNVRTTYISGMLTNGAEEAVQFLFWLAARGRALPLGVRLRLVVRQQSFNRLVLYFGIWLAYVVGAVVGVSALGRWELPSLLAPIACLAILAVFGLIQPIFPLPEQRSRRQWQP